MPLLHLTTPADWRAALRTGVVAPPSLAEAGFVHLSTAAQVALPASRLFAGRRDLLLLAVDPATIGCEIRWEPGVPGDPGALRFPHAYGPVPVSAVVAVSAYRPRPDGGFEAPSDPAARADHAARLRAFADSVPRRLATTEVPVSGGIAVLSDDVPAAPRLNQLLVGDIPAREIAAEADRVLGGAGRAHRHVTLRGTDPGAVAHELGRSGWRVRHEIVLARETGDPGPGPRAAEVTLGEIRDTGVGTWHPDLPGHALVEDRGVDLRLLAVRAAGRDGDRIVAAAALALDGATAALRALGTVPAERGRGHVDTLLRGADAIAREAGCDVLALDVPADRPRRERLARHGFALLGETWAAHRGSPPAPGDG